MDNDDEDEDEDGGVDSRDDDDDEDECAGAGSTAWILICHSCDELAAITAASSANDEDDGEGDRMVVIVGETGGNTHLCTNTKSLTTSSNR